MNCKDQASVEGVLYILSIYWTLALRSDIRFVAETKGRTICLNKSVNKIREPLD